MGRKETTLYAFWSKREHDLMLCWPKSKCDGSLLHSYFSPKWGPDWRPVADLIDELEKRGYDKNTFRFSIKLKGGEDVNGR